MLPSNSHFIDRANIPSSKSSLCDAACASFSGTPIPARMRSLKARLTRNISVTLLSVLSSTMTIMTSRLLKTATLHTATMSQTNARD
ncbi:hypothetical protein LSAT2_028661, partial [Lamellibrachia satsuma]